MKKYLFLLSAMCALTFIGCSDDSETEKALVGNWLLTAEWDGWVNPDTGKEEGELDPYTYDEAFILILDKDGMATCYWDTSDPNDVDSAPYSYDSSTNTIYLPILYDSDRVVIESLTDDQLILKCKYSTSIGDSAEGFEDVTIVEKQFFSRM